MLVGSIFWGFRPLSVSATPQFLEVQVTPSGDITLSVNQTQNLSTNILSDVNYAPYIYNWTYSVTGNESVTVHVNGEQHILSGQGYLSDAASLNFSFTVASEETVVLFLRVQSTVTGSYGYALPVTLHDPYTAPDLYLQSFPSSGVFIAPDNTGWYAEINYTGQIIRTSTDAASLIRNSVASKCFLRSGTYTITSCIAITHPVIIEGEGDSTILDVPSGQTTSVFGISASHVTICNLKIQGHHWRSTGQNWWTVGDGTGTPEQYTVSACIGFGGITDLTVDHVTTENYGWGINGCNSTGIKVQNCVFKDMIVGVQIEGSLSINMSSKQGTYGIIIDNNIIENTYDDGIDINGANGGAISTTSYAQSVLITNNHIFHNDVTGGGIKLDCNGASLGKITISNNFVYNSSVAIYATTWLSSDLVNVPTQLIVTGNHLYPKINPGGAGTAVGFSLSSKSCLWSNSIFSNNIVEGSCVPIAVYNVAGVKIQGNTLIQTSYQPIALVNLQGDVDIDFTENTLYPASNVAQKAIELGYCIATRCCNNRIVLPINHGATLTITNSQNSQIENNLFEGAKPTIIDTSTGTVIRNNQGYNPVGYIANPITGSTQNIVDSGSNSTWLSGVTYTNTQSPKMLYITGEGIQTIAVNGETLFTGAGSYSVMLQPNETFNITFTTPPTVTVMGQ